ncbi:hypothetical protein L0337_27545 [candidate division KSB1 bacterium]|nr:hypothetical protein [candidate division KSB1 bacterium]
MNNPMQKFTIASCLDFMRQKRLHEDTGKIPFAQADFSTKTVPRQKMIGVQATVRTLRDLSKLVVKNASVLAQKRPDGKGFQKLFWLSSQSFIIYCGECQKFMKKRACGLSCPRCARGLESPRSSRHFRKAQ